VIKVCGITRAEDARRLAPLGVDLLGLVFAASPRQLTFDAAAQLLDGVEGPERVGVFVDAPVAAMVGAARRLNLAYVQLHGRETDVLVTQLQFALLKERLATRILRVLKPASREELAAALEQARYPHVDGFIVEPAASARPSWDWAWAEPAAAVGKPWMIAGGLDASNCAAALVRSGAPGIDVSSGVESSPGIKDPARLQALVQEVLRVRASQRAAAAAQGAS
jgi:phosphoribosylanthranilate isomerase